MIKIVSSFAVGVLVLIIFVALTISSRRSMPVGLRDVYGDTSGIHNLVIQGEVESWSGRYGYSFNIGPDRVSTRMDIPRNTQGLVRLHMRGWQFSQSWHIPWFQLAYMPVGPYEMVTAASERSFTHGPGGLVPLDEYRIYGDVFEVRPQLMSHMLLVSPCEATSGGLYIDLGEGGYIFSFHPEMHDFSPGVSLLRSSLLHNEARIGDARLFVPSGSGLFGNTAVYIVHMPGGVLPTIEVSTSASPFSFPMVRATALFPVELRRGEDEILGLIELDDDVLLFVRRAGGLEVTRICPFYGESQTVFVEGLAGFSAHFLLDDSLVLRSFRTQALTADITVAIDLRDGGLAVYGVFSEALGEEAADTSPSDVFVEIYDKLLRDGIIYIVYSVRNTASDFPLFAEEIFVSAFDSLGRLVGRSQVLTGVEDDIFWRWDFQTRHLLGGSPISARRIQTMSIQGG